MADRDRSQERSRLIDHFKRVYTIIAGLALTEACRHSVPASLADLESLPLLAFFTMFFTIIPIFHGGDRSLDLKYLGAAPGRWWPSYAWDVYMLLLTALFFVGVGEAIPWHKEPGQTVGTYAGFYWWLSATLGLDIIVLAVDRVKDSWWSRRGNADAQHRLKPYPYWIVFNLLFGLICAWTAYCIGDEMTGPALIKIHVSRTDLFDISLSELCIIMLLLSIVRTIADYTTARDFLFP